MKNDTTTSSSSIELSNDELALAQGGLPHDPHDDPGGPTGHPLDLEPFQIPPGKLPRTTFPPPYRAPGDKPLPGEQTPPIKVFPTA